MDDAGCRARVAARTNGFVANVHRTPSVGYLSVDGVRTAL